MTGSLLLDTHAFIWLMEGDDILSKTGREALQNAARDHCLYLAAISVWEIAMLESKGRLSFKMPLPHWINKATSLPFLKVVDLTPEIALESCQLPGVFHGDPADRMIVATARLLTVPIVTRDQKILSYAEGGFLDVLAC